MNLCVFVFLLFINYVCQHEVELPVVPIKDRIKYLKHKIREEVHSQPNRHAKSRVVYENYDYVDISLPITPIMDNDDRKRDNKFKLRQLKTTLTTTMAPNPTPKMWKPTDETVKPVSKKIGKVKSKNVSRATEQPKDIFYRRDNYECWNTPLEWTHCVVMVTPYLKGTESNLKNPKIYDKRHRVVSRFLQLLKVNVQEYGKEDVLSLLYQISNIKIRLFQWHVSAISALLNVICKGEKHNFLSLKRGLKNLIQSWNMDLSNTTRLVRQTRIIRPHCIRYGDLEGSTKTSMVSRHTITTPRNSDEDK